MDDRPVRELPRRAMSTERWSVILGALEAMSTSQPAAERMVFLLQFLEATGLRAAELLGGRLGDFQRLEAGWRLQVRNQGAVRRVIPVAGQAQRALLRYLGSRGLDAAALDHRPDLPILAKLDDPTQPLTYRPLYGTMKNWLNKAIDACDLSWADKVDAARASPQWLRNTCGTRALERGVPQDVVGQLLGHADPRTTARYRQPADPQRNDALAMAFA
jgi:integrase